MMDVLKQLKEKNPTLKLYSVHDAEFEVYGRVLDDVDTSDVVSVGEGIINEGEGGYMASVPALEALPMHQLLQERFFGQMPVQSGFVYGKNNRMNALEWHKSSEVNVAAADLVLLLGKVEDVYNGTCHSDKVKGFLLKKREAVEVYATSLHFTPCAVHSSGMGALVGLPLGTNTPLQNEASDRFLRNKNKWVVCSCENRDMIGRGIEGLVGGINLTVNPVD